jgi:hypothetical protein
MIRVASPAAVLRCLIDRSDSMRTISSLKPSGFEHLHRLKIGRRRDLAIEYTLITLMVAFAAFQVLLAVGAKADTSHTLTIG